LKGLWKRYKIECRKNCNKERSEIRQTGGGPQPKKCDQIDDYISSFIHSVEPEVNPFDDDFVNEHQSEESHQSINYENINESDKQLNDMSTENQNSFVITLESTPTQYITQTPSIKSKRKSTKSSHIVDSEVKSNERQEWMEMQKEKHSIEIQILKL